MGDGDRLHRLQLAYRSFGAPARIFSTFASCPAALPLAGLPRRTGQPSSTYAKELLRLPGLALPFGSERERVR